VATRVKRACTRKKAALLVGARLFMIARCAYRAFVSFSRLSALSTCCIFHILKIENFCWRIHDGEVIRIERLIPSFTVKNHNDDLNFAMFDWSDDVREFVARGRAAGARAAAMTALNRQYAALSPPARPAGGGRDHGADARSCASGRTYSSRLTSVLPGSSHGAMWAECSNHTACFDGAFTCFSQASVGAVGVV